MAWGKREDEGIVPDLFQAVYKRRGGNAGTTCVTVLPMRAFGEGEALWLSFALAHDVLDDDQFIATSEGWRQRLKKTRGDFSEMEAGSGPCLLEELYIAGNRTLGEEAIEALAFAVGASSSSGSLRRFGLGFRDFSDKGMEVLVSGLIEGRRSAIKKYGEEGGRGGLQWIDLELKGLGPASGAHIGRLIHGGIFSGCKGNSGAELSLARNALGDLGIENLVTASREMLACVRSLDLRSNGLSDMGVEALFGMYVNVSSSVQNGVHRIEILDLSENECIGPRSGDSFQRVLSRDSSEEHYLTELKLNRCSLGCDGIQRMTARANPAGEKWFLSRLEIQENGIGMDGGKALSRLLRSPSCALKHLSLSGNPLGDDAAVEVLSSALCPEQSSLESLELFQVGLTDVGAANIVNFMLHGLQTPEPSSHALKELDIGGNGVTLHGLVPILSLLNNPNVLPRLEMIMIAGNPGCEADAIEESIDACTRARQAAGTVPLTIAWRSKGESQRDGA